MRVGILGAGSWGITLGILLHRKGYDVILYEHREEKAEYLERRKEDPRRLPGVRIPDEVHITPRVSELFPADFLVFAVPSQTVREVARKVRDFKPSRVISAVKGIELDSLKRMSEVLEEELGEAARIAVLSGPSIAVEVLRGDPSSVVVASRDPEYAKEVQLLFHSGRFRVYRSGDVVGVELGGAFKNIIAIGAGAVDGMGFGVNSKGALITRGLAEIMRLGVKMGADPLTFSGLAGVGDLITTCFSKNSRNRHVGEELGKGRKIDEILAEMSSVAEGVKTAEAACILSEKLGVEMPLTHAIWSLISGKMDRFELLRGLMEREPKEEIYWTTRKGGP
ncbi:MAG TPA: NAD(P)-dependent glycerol-3-phosphate dehydrogenase [candidate division WOR-3 bacterium]|uniref:Glycerol-3-phosphate dehydrogenase [NAD(P)+] n=1 Tax=candidate division WOR-3 bacterium TaxID=2052148 RepID=A0A7C0X9Y6_UNCW3|nr:NAD(P)-dependent glycerol-3-phosphate dehydrogenase [candidate division WOR-3 bacterium]